MKSKPQHTPTPFDLRSALRMRSDITNEEIEHIVRAVNCHEELVTALRAMLEASHNGPERILQEDEIEAMMKARTAIAKAEGKVA